MTLGPRGEVHKDSNGYCPQYSCYKEEEQMFLSIKFANVIPFFVAWKKPISFGIGVWRQVDERCQGTDTYGRF